MSHLEEYKDTELFQRISEADEGAFKQLFRKYTLQLRPFIYNLDRSDILVDEVIQETMIRVWLNRDLLTEIAAPKSWIFKIAANQYFTLRKRLLRKEQIDTKFGFEQARQEEIVAKLDFQQLAHTIQQGIALLPEQRKKVYLLRREAGLTLPEIAAELQISSNTVRNTLASANAFIREFLRDRGYDTTVLLAFLSLL